MRANRSTGSISSEPCARNDASGYRDYKRIPLLWQRFGDAVFVHRVHISTIRATFDAIWRQWQPHDDAIDAPFFERYGEDLDARAGIGPVEIRFRFGRLDLRRF